MKVAKRCKVEVKKDHLSKVAASSAKMALAELIWNSLDADAKNVSVNFYEGALGIDRVVVQDDGTGIPYKEAENLFISLGGSWKAQDHKTGSGRFLHGKEGQGRFKAFSIGRIVHWKVTYQQNGELFEYTIEGKANALDEFVLSEITPSLQKNTGVTVIVSELEKKFHILNHDNALVQLSPLFALYLKNYKDVTLRIADKKVEPDSIIRNRQIFPLPCVTTDDNDQSVELELLEWNGIYEQELWFCDSRGFPLEPCKKQIRGVGDFGYTAYLKSDYFRILHNKGDLSLGDLEKTLGEISDEAVKIIREYFLGRKLEEARDQLDEWKQEDVYPFQGEPISPVEEAERKVFDIIAINVNQNLPNFKDSDKKSKQFQFRMLRHAIEKSPEDLQKILIEVLNLSKSSRENLVALLEDTSLTSIINASRIVTDRINFIVALEHLIYDYKENLKERSQLHRLLAKNTWIFGDAFTLSVDDKSLTEVLKKHASSGKIEINIDEPVKRIDGKTGIIDLMLSRQIPRNHNNELEHLIVELKAPQVIIGKKEIDQIEGYAIAVASDERFRGMDTKWHFWLIANDYDQYAKIKLSDKNNNEGILFHFKNDINVTVWLKTWSQLLNENKHRLSFIRDKLNYNIDRNQALHLLKKTYAEYIDGIKVLDKTVQD